MTKLDYFRLAVEGCFVAAFFCQVMVNRAIVKIVKLLLKRIEVLEHRSNEIS